MKTKSNWDRKRAARRRGELIGESIAYALIAALAVGAVLLIYILLKWLYSVAIGV